MASNPFYDQFEEESEQNLYEDIIVEAIRFAGKDVVYLPRETPNYDLMLNEPRVVTFDTAIDIEMYFESFSAFGGEGKLMAKFGVEVRDKITLRLSFRSFNEFIQPVIHTEKPRQGDCIYVPMLKQIYEIQYVNSTPEMFILGRQYFWDLDCELIEFSNEQFNTGRPEIDDLNTRFENVNDPDYNITDYDESAKNNVIQEESNKILDFSEMNFTNLGEE